MIHDLLRAIGIRDFTIRLNNRMLLTGLLERHGLAERSAAVLRALDKLGKIGADKVAEEMVATAGATPEQASEVLKLAEVSGSERRNPAAGRAAGGRQRHGRGRRGQTPRDARRPGRRGRGRTAGEARRSHRPRAGLLHRHDLRNVSQRAALEIGSICSGGRYDNLAELYTNQELPGIGASLGLDRLLAALEKLGLVEKVATPAPVFIPYFDAARLHDYLRMAAALRAAGIGVEIYPEAKKLGQQLKYADRRGFRIALIAGQNEFDRGVCQVKDLQCGEKKDVPLAGNYAELIEAVLKLLR